MKIGSHNSFTYLKPKKWWMGLCIPFAKCQSKDIGCQFEAGARYFDLRIRFDKPNIEHIVVAHGLMEYKIDWSELLYIISVLDNLAAKEKIYIRLLYEMPSKDYSKDAISKEYAFRDICKFFVVSFPNITFCGGQRKYDWKLLVELAPHPESIDLYSSRTGTILDNWCPWFYARFMNNKNYKKYKDKEPKDGFILMDFVNNIKR